MARTFGTILKDAIDRSPYSQTDFADRVGVSKQLITDMIKDRTPGPDDAANAWCDALGLRGKQRQDFMDATALSNLRPSLREHFRGLLDRHDAAEQDA
jgi:hypothetical protein